MQVPELDGEEYYTMRDEFMRYIEDQVNPARISAGLEPIREHEGRECYRILYDFWRNWEKKF